MHMNIDNRMAYYPDERFNPFERTSKLFNEYGIKGIKYNGRQDGECYVIFDDKAVNILKTYYQSAKVGDNIAKSKEKYLNSKQSALKNFYDIHRNFTENEPEQYTGKKTIKNILKYLGSKDNKKAEIKTPIENVTITRNDVKHLLDDNEKERSNNINKIVETLKKPNLVITVDSQENKKNYYLKTFNSKDKKTAHLQVIKCCKDGNFYVTNFHLKNGKLNQLLKNGQITYDLSDKSAVQNAPDNNIINDNLRNFNPTTYKQEIQPSEVVFGNRPKTLEEIHEDVRQRAKGLEYLGYFTQENGKHIIGIMENANPSTIIHELSHSYLEALRNLALTDKNMAVKYEAVKKWLGVYGNQELTKAQHETFARGFEAYVYSGKAPNSKLQEVFTLFKNWLKDIRDYWLNNTDYKMSDEVRKVFDTIFEENNNELDKKQKKIKI